MEITFFFLYNIPAHKKLLNITGDKTEADIKQKKICMEKMFASQDVKIPAGSIVAYVLCQPYSL